MIKIRHAIIIQQIANFLRAEVNITRKQNFSISVSIKDTISKKFVIDYKMVNRNMSLTLYKADQSPPARAVMMLIEILGLKDVKMEDLNPIARDQDDPEFIKMNPQRTIPILRDGDFGLGDSHAIMIYLMDNYGKPEHAHLYPKDTKKRAIVHHRLFLDCGILFPRLRAIMSPTYFGRLTELSKYIIQNNEDAYSMLEACLAQSRFIAGDSMTIADLSIYTTVLSLDTVHTADEERFPKLRQWLKTMSETEAIKKVDDPDGRVHGKTLLTIMQMNKENQEMKKSKL